MTVLHRLKKKLQDNLSLSSKLFLRRVYSESMKTARGLTRFPGRVAKRVVSAVADRLGIDHPLALKAKGYSLETPSLAAVDFDLSEHLLAESKPAGGPAPATIHASIIIPVFNKAEFTFQCIRSLIQEINFRQNEVIVVDNASTDQTAAVLAHFENIVRVIRNEENRGVVEACNQGAALARGEYLLFLNNDTVVLPGWLSGLVDTADKDQSVGAVGSMFLYPDGRLREAGAIVWKDGHAHHHGWGQPPDDRRYNFARDVDYCSGASLLIRRELFEQLGGFDLRFAPAYYEDIDVCFGVRSLGRRVVYQPASRLIHYEGVTAGRDTQIGTKLFQEVNREKFVSKWRVVLERENLEHHPRNLGAAANRKSGPSIVVFDDRVPAPDRDAGSARMFQILKSLAQWSKPVFVSLGQPLPDYEKLLWKEGIETGIAVDYARLLNERKFAVALLSRPEIANAMLKRIRRTSPQTRIIFDMVDAYFIRLQREYEINGEEKVRKEARRYRKLETRLAQVVDQVWCTSPEDKRVVATLVPADKIVVVPTIHSLRARTNGFDERSGLLFVGHLAHRPNSDGIQYFIKEVFPWLRALIPDVSLDVVGTSTPEVAAYNSRDVRVRGYVPDIAPFFENSRVFVAPLRFGAGTRGKIGDALAYGLPVVTTSVGAEGTGVRHGIDAMIADDPESFAVAVKELYSCEELWRQLADNGYDHVGRNFSPEIIEQVLLDALGELNVLKP